MDEEYQDNEVGEYARDIDLSLKRDKDWQKEGERTIKVYRNDRRIGPDNEKRKDTFNILWSNVETLRPALYSTPPRPDIRRRFKDKDVLGSHISEILERASSYAIEAFDFDSAMIAAVNDMLLPGRGVTRVRYVPTMQEEEADDAGNVTQQEAVTAEEIEYEHVEWDKFLLGPGERWEDMPWVAFKHEMSKDEIEELAPDFVDEISYDVPEGSTEKEKKEQRLYKRTTVWEIWCKEDRQVRWFCEGYKDDFLKIEEDPLNLQHFWPIPRPCYSIESTTSLIPITEYSQYETLAIQLERITGRWMNITNSLRVRGVYDSTMSELRKLFDSSDNEMIPAENINRLLEGGGLDKAIWMFPNEPLANVLMILQQSRQQTIQQIYELTGISDILRGSSNPHETLGAQKIKANFGSQRLQKRQREVQRYARDLLRLTVEIISEKFMPQTLMQMTGLKYPSMQEKQAIQMQVQMQQQQAAQQQQIAQQSGQQPPQPPQIPPEVQELLQKPTWEELKQVMTSDVLRAYKVDIETNSTIEADQQEDQQSLAALVQAFSQLSGQMGAAIQSGMISQNASKKLLSGILHRFKFGREVEDALNENKEQGGPTPQEQQQQAEQQKMQAEQQAKQAEMQGRAALEQAKMQLETQKHQDAMKLKQMEAQMKAQGDEREFQLAQQKMQLDAQIKQQELSVEERELALKDREVAVKEMELQLDAKRLESDTAKWQSERKVADFKYGRAGGLRSAG